MMTPGIPALYQAGIDVGGTKTMFCIIDTAGNIVLMERKITAAHSDPELFFAWLFGELKDLLKGMSLGLDRLESIGIGFPGVIGNIEGVLTHAPALPWPEVGIRPIIRHYYKGELYLDNDVNLALLGECWMGAARGKNHVLMMTVGTGIGSAMLLNGQLYKGANYAAGEAGYFIVEAGEYRKGHTASGASFGPLEAAASGTGITALARTYLEAAASPESLILELAEGNTAAINTRHVLQAAAQGDAAALEIMDRPLNCMAAGIANAVLLLNPQLVVLGGGVAESGGYYVNEVSGRIQSYMPYPVVVKPAMLGNEAGAIGAAIAISAKFQ